MAETKEVSGSQAVVQHTTFAQVPVGSKFSIVKANGTLGAPMVKVSCGSASNSDPALRVPGAHVVTHPLRDAQTVVCV